MPTDHGWPDYDVPLADPKVSVVQVANYMALCPCGWRSVEYGDLRGAQRSGEHHLRERHSKVPPRIDGKAVEHLLGDNVCPFSQRVDGPRHGWRFDGDDPYVECHWCGQVRDAQTDRIIRQGRRHNDGGDGGV